MKTEVRQKLTRCENIQQPVKSNRFMFQDSSIDSSAFSVKSFYGQNRENCDLPFRKKQKNKDSGAKENVESKPAINRRSNIKAGRKVCKKYMLRQVLNPNSRMARGCRSKKLLHLNLNHSQLLSSSLCVPEKTHNLSLPDQIQSSVFQVSQTFDSVAVSNGLGKNKRFFKHRVLPSGSRGDSKGTESGRHVVIKWGFNLKFVPRRLSSSFEKNNKTDLKVGKSANTVVSCPRKTLMNIDLQRQESNFNIKQTVCRMTAGNVGILRSISDKSSSGMIVDTNVSCDSAYSPAVLTSDTQTGILSALSDSDFGSQDLFMEDLNDIETTMTLGSEVGVQENKAGECRKDLTQPSSNEPARIPKLFPLFLNKNTAAAETSQKTLPLKKLTWKLPKFIKDSENEQQLILDAGQKKFGAIRCPVCGMVYTQADPTDETTHARFHHRLLTALKFPGWKKERVVQEFPEDCSRIIVVLPDDPKYAIKKVEEINKMMNDELGFPDTVLAFRPDYKVFIYVSGEKKRVNGCCIAESVTEGFRVISDGYHWSSSQSLTRRHPFCCHTVPEPAAIGISKIWVYGPERRQGIASKLLNCVRQWFEYGLPVEREQLAFSDPTPSGLLLATKYTGTPFFLVYRCVP